MAEYKKYNSNASFVIHHARVTGDVKKISDTFVKIPTVVTSANDKDDDIWIDIVPNDGQAPLAEFVEKGDLISVEGFLTKQTWGENDDKTGFTLRNARLMLSPEQIATLKERGFTPGGGKSKGKSKPAKSGKAKREIEVPADDEE